MGVSLYNIAEKICDRISRQGDIQAIISAVIDAYSTLARRDWFENKNDGSEEISGAFLYTFGKTTPLTPILDLSTDEYYIVIPSSSLNLPNEMGINWVSFQKDKVDFVRITNSALWNNLKASVLGGRNTYRTEGNRMYFPKMTNNSTGDILLKLAVALDNVDVDEELNIPGAMIDQMVDMVVQKYAPQPPVETKAII